MTDKELIIHDLSLAAASHLVANCDDGDKGQIKGDPEEVMLTRLISEYARCRDFIKGNYSFIDKNEDLKDFF